jgi:hypothetical protein
VSASRRESAGGSGISLQTLLIASLSSLAAAVLVHEVWRGGAIVGAAVTPIIVGIVGEALSRPARKLTAVRQVRRAEPERRPEPDELPQASRDRPAEDRFGIWDDRRPRASSRRRAWWRIGLVTGVLGFAAAAFALTGGELVFGGAVTGTSHRTTLLGGNDRSGPATPATTTTVVTQTTTGTTTVPADTTRTTAPDAAATAPVDPAQTGRLAPPATTTTPPPAATTPPQATTPATPTP